MRHVTITLAGMRLHCIIGCNKEERISPQEIVVDLSFIVQVAANDALVDTVNYDEVVALVQQHLKESKYQLLETAVSAVAEIVLESFAKIISVKVRIAKPSALTSCNEVSCEIFLKR